MNCPTDPVAFVTHSAVVTQTDPGSELERPETIVCRDELFLRQNNPTEVSCALWLTHGAFVFSPQDSNLADKYN